MDDQLFKYYRLIDQSSSHRREALLYVEGLVSALDRGAARGKRGSARYA